MWQSKAEHLRFDQRKSWTEIAIELQEYFPNVRIDKIKQKVRDYIRTTEQYRAEHSEEETYKETTQLKADGSFFSDKLIEIHAGEHLTPELLKAKHNLVPEEWEVVSYTNNLWHSQKKGGSLLTMYQSKLTVKPKTGLSYKAIDEHFSALDRTAKPLDIVYQKHENGLDVEVNIADLHLGKLCWHGDTGNNFDYKIARDTFYRIVNEIAGELQGKPIDRILFVWANDFFNSDTISKTTTAGTPQDTDIRWQKLFDVGVEMLVTAILTLVKIAPVTTFYTRSNHDETTCYHALKYLEAFFKSQKEVTINTSPMARKYYLLGNTLVGFAHGDKENPKKLAGIMPVEVPEQWAKARYREFHTAHLHSEHAIEEINGVIVRRISSPTATDTYHYENGYVGAVRKAQTFIYDKTRGLRQIINTIV